MNVLVEAYNLVLKKNRRFNKKNMKFIIIIIIIIIVGTWAQSPGWGFGPVRVH